MNISQQPSIIIPQTTTSIEEFCNDNMDCLSLSDFTQNTRSTLSMYEPLIYPTQRNPQFNDNHNYNMAQGFIDPYMNVKGQSVSGSSTITTQQQLQLNVDGVPHDSYCNTTFLPTALPGVIDTLHQVMIFFKDTSPHLVLKIYISIIYL